MTVEVKCSDFDDYVDVSTEFGAFKVVQRYTVKQVDGSIKRGEIFRLTYSLYIDVSYVE
jgi:hypothetical protein